MLTLFDYFRSSASYRVRIALNLKGLPYERSEVHLLRDGGEQRHADYLAINPSGRVPALALETGEVITQSLAIIEWLEEIRPEPSILPSDPIARAQSRAIACIVACDVHPLNNLSTLAYLRERCEQDQAARDRWYGHWITEGFRAVEALIRADDYCFGPYPTVADIVLIPQIFNARRFNVRLEAFPKIRAVETKCGQIDAFARAHPDAIAQR